MLVEALDHMPIWNSIDLKIGRVVVVLPRNGSRVFVSYFHLCHRSRCSCRLLPCISKPLLLFLASWVVDHIPYLGRRLELAVPLFKLIYLIINCAHPFPQIVQIIL
jgi:hypothetical protein